MMFGESRCVVGEVRGQFVARLTEGEAHEALDPVAGESRGQIAPVVAGEDLEGFCDVAEAAHCFEA